MNKLFFTKSIAIAILLIFSADLFAGTEFLRKYERRAIPKVSIPDVKEVTLSNGLTCFLAEDHTIPVVRLSVVFKAGSIYEPPDKIGLAELTSSTARTGGTKDISPDEFDVAIDKIGADISMEADNEVATAGISVLSSDIDRGLDLFFQMIFSPRFDEKRLEVNKRKFKESLLRERDDPARYTSRLFRQMVYGDESPWARIPTDRTITSISSRDIKEFHSKYFRTANAYLAIAGDFDSNDFLSKIEKLTSGLSADKVELPDVPAVIFELKPEYEHVDGPYGQGFVRMGHLGVKRHNPDWFSLQVLSEIFGGGNFKSRLMSELRVKRGLAYSPTGGITQGVDYGLFVVRFSTELAKVDDAVEIAKELIEKISEGKDITQTELDFAKNYLLSRSIFDIDTPFRAVTGQMAFKIYGYPKNYWLKKYNGISKVNLTDLKDVAAKYIHPEDLKVLVVGPK